MRNFLAEHSGAFDPDEVHTLVAAFDKAWEAIQASGVVYPEAKAETVRAILAKHIIAAAKNGERDHGWLRDGALLALAQANLRPQIVRRGKAASVCGLTSSRVVVRPGPSLTGFSKTAPFSHSQ
jgi:hypothetical protein